MDELATARHALPLVLRALRAAFENYDQRCLYAAVGLKEILRQEGFDAVVHGGDFLSLVVSTNGRAATMQGYGKVGTGGDVSHYWVETPSLHLDLGPHLLPRASPFPAAEIPLLAWRKSHLLPAALRYRTRDRYDPCGIMVFPDGIARRMELFLADVMARWYARQGSLPSRTWFLSDRQSLAQAATRDMWARGVLRFERISSSQAMPF